MFKLQFSFVLTIFLFPFFLFSQQLKKDIDFSRLDSIAKTVKYKDNIYRLTNDLTKVYSEPLLKARAIFIWITDNIGYDYKFVNKGKDVKTPQCKPGMDCGQMRVEWEKKYIDRVIKRKKGVCDGYAMLFKKMSDIAGIRSEIISGYTKTKPYQVGNAGIVNHAWNAVWLDTAYYFLDPTWAAGGCVEDDETGMLLSFQKEFDNYYWLTPFRDFSRNHYPQNGKWLLEPNYTKEKFAANPYYASDEISKIQLLTPGSGVINAKKGDTIQFKLDYKGFIRQLQVNSNVSRSPAIWYWETISKRKKVWKEDTLAMKRQQYTPFKQIGNRYQFEYIVTDNSLYYLDILFNYRRVMRFKVNIDR